MQGHKMVQDNFKVMHNSYGAESLCIFHFIFFTVSERILQTSFGLCRRLLAALTSKLAMMSVLFAVYHQDVFIEPAEGVKQAVKEHKLQFLYYATTFVKRKGFAHAINVL